MLNKIIHFVKYNNATIIIIVIVLVVGTSVFASETGREAIGKKYTSIEGVDNILLIEADLDNFDMEYKIENIKENEENYFITYTFLDLVKINNVWQYMLKENIRKVSKKNKKDLGLYLAEELKEEYEAKIKKLKKEQDEAREQGQEERIEVVEYSGLIGKALDITGKVFSNYEPVKKKKLKSPVAKDALRELKQGEETETSAPVSSSDNLTQIYKDYIAENDPDNDNIFGTNDNCPAIYNPEQTDSDSDGVGDACDIDSIVTEESTVNNNEDIGNEPESVEIIELEDIEETDLTEIQETEEASVEENTENSVPVQSQAEASAPIESETSSQEAESEAPASAEEASALETMSEAGPVEAE